MLAKTQTLLRARQIAPHTPHTQRQPHPSVSLQVEERRASRRMNRLCQRWTCTAYCHKETPRLGITPKSVLGWRSSLSIDICMAQIATIILQILYENFIPCLVRKRLSELDLGGNEAASEPIFRSTFDRDLLQATRPIGIALQATSRTMFDPAHLRAASAASPPTLAYGLRHRTIGRR
jgi:hypothetical protein